MNHRAPARQPGPGNLDHQSDNGGGKYNRGAEAFQHPLTLALLFLAGLGLIHLLGLSPLPVSQLWGAPVLLVAAGATAGAYYWAYSLRHRPPQSDQPAEREDPSEAAEQEELTQLRASLEKDFSALSWAAGLKSLAELEYEYQQLQALLDSFDDFGGLSANHVPRLARETYRQGLKVLSNARELMQAVHASHREKLEVEIAELESEVETMRQEQAPAERVRYREETIGSHRRRLALLDQQQPRVDELLYQAELCEASLARAHIELAALRAGESDSSVSTVTSTLQSTIDVAREVQEELRQMGF